MITLECNYSKKIGLPGYSSHQFCVTLRTEIADLSQVQAESGRLYALLQASVDTELQQTGFNPGAENGHGQAPAGRNGRANGYRNGNGNGSAAAEVWVCTPKQKGLILGLVDEHKIDKTTVEALAQQLFRKGVRQLNKLEASGLIDEMIEKYAPKGNGNPRYAPRGGGR